MYTECEKTRLIKVILSLSERNTVRCSHSTFFHMLVVVHRNAVPLYCMQTSSHCTHFNHAVRVPCCFNVYDTHGYRAGEMEIVKYLVEVWHCNVNCRDKCGKTLLHWCLS